MKAVEALEINMSQLLQDALTAGLSQLYGAASNYTDRPDVDGKSKRRLAAATAASVIGASLDKLNNANLSDTTTDEEDTDNFWTSDFDDTLTPLERKKQKKLAKQQEHFIDVFLEKLLIHALPATIPEKDQLHERINDPIRTHTESLSISKFASNLTKLTAKLGGIFQAQYFVLRIFHWTQPSLTLTALIIYTLIVLHPNALFILPLFFLMYGIMVPGYVYRHPIQNPELLEVKERGDSLLDKFTRLKDERQLEAFLDEDRFEKEMIENRVPEIEENGGSSSKLLVKNMELFINMRDLQNIMTEVLKVSEKFEAFWYGTAGFKDERTSTSLFFTVFFSSLFLIGIGPYIPWKFLLIVSGWSSLIVIHPRVLPRVKEFDVLFQSQKQELDKIVKDSERKDIVIDEAPEIKEVEIFEIWKKSITSSQWEFYIYSSNVFDINDYYRKSQKPPPGVFTLDRVLCPKSWKFDDETWNVDYNCKDWVHSRGLALYGNSYIDKNDEFYVDDDFKRRRLYRSVIRYSKPARKPPHLL